MPYLAEHAAASARGTVSHAEISHEAPGVEGDMCNFTRSKDDRM